MSKSARVTTHRKVDLTLREVLHDLRHTCATVRTLAEAALLVPGVPPNATTLLGQILEETETMRRMTRASTGEAPRQVRPVRLDRLAAAVVDELRPRFGGALTVQAEQVTVELDATDGRRILQNVLTNAFDAAGPSGSVDVRVGIDGDDGVVTVTDSGNGLERPVHHIGLGLVIVEGLTRANGGRARVDVGHVGGTRVVLTFPAAAVQSPRAIRSTLAWSAAQ